MLTLIYNVDDVLSRMYGSAAKTLFEEKGIMDVSTRHVHTNVWTHKNMADVLAEIKQRGSKS